MHCKTRNCMNQVETVAKMCYFVAVVQCEHSFMHFSIPTSFNNFFCRFHWNCYAFYLHPSVCLHYSIINAVSWSFGTCQFPYPNDVSDWYWNNVGKWSFPIWWSTLWPKMTYQWHVPNWSVLWLCNIDVLCRLYAISVTRYPFSEIPKMALFWSPSHVKNVGLLISGMQH